MSAGERDQRRAAALTPLRTMRLYFYFLEKIVERGFGNYPGKLGAVIAYQTHVVYHHIVHFPLAIDVV